MRIEESPRSIEASRAIYAQLDKENKCELLQDAIYEATTGITIPRCPTCGGRRRNPALGKACAYCGRVVE